MIGPGIYHDLPATEYHALPYLSSTWLKRFRACPASALAPMEETDSMRIGRAVHSYLLEGPEAFDAEFAVLFESDLNKNSTAYKAAKAEWELANQGRTILPAKIDGVGTLSALRAIRASIDAHPMASLLLRGGRQEVSLVWEDEATGERCKARLDHNPGHGAIVDLKTCSDVSRFRNQVHDLGYPIQAAHYMEGANVHGLDIDTFVFVAVEPSEPYSVVCGYLAPSWLEWARLETKRLVGLAAECRRENTFPNYKIPSHVYHLSDIQPADLLAQWEMPSWAR